MAELKGAYGHCVDVRKVRSRQVTQLIIELPVEYHNAATQLLDSKDVWVEQAPVDIQNIGKYCVIVGGPVMAEKQRKNVGGKPYGKEASELYKSGFWLVPAVCAALGTDAEYRAWIQQQQCVVCGEMDWVEHLGVYRCEAAHVKRPSNSGVRHRPEHSCVPLCHQHHQPTQHQWGLPYLHQVYLHQMGKIEALPHPHKTFTEEQRNAAREWFDKERDKHLIEWATMRAALIFGKPSTGFIPPPELVKWARENNIEEHLPEAYTGSV